MMGRAEESEAEYAAFDQIGEPNPSRAEGERLLLEVCRGCGKRRQDIPDADLFFDIDRGVVHRECGDIREIEVVPASALQAAQEEVERLKGSDAHYRASYKQKLDEKMYVEKLLLAAQERTTEAERELDESRGREPGIAGPRDYEFAERIFAGWRERAEAAEKQVSELKEALARIATAHAPAKHLQNIARAALTDEAKPE